jgi:hypothetical protein
MTVGMCITAQGRCRKINLWDNSAHFLAELTLQFLTVKGKGKAIPLQAWTGPEGSRRLRLPDFKTVGT